MKLLKQCRVAANISAIQQGNVEFQIVAVQLAALRQGTGGGADTEMQVPESLRYLRDHSLLRVFAQGRVMQEKHIHIRTGEQRTTTVAAKGGDAHPVWRA